MSSCFTRNSLRTNAVECIPTSGPNARHMVVSMHYVRCSSSDKFSNVPIWILCLVVIDRGGRSEFSPCPCLR
eukprot:scaffold53090_cov18-Prasinocladus_malaysianus.AAC.1